MNRLVVLKKFHRYARINKVLCNDELLTGDRFDVDGYGYSIIRRIDHTETSTTVWVVKKIGSNKVVVVFKPTKEFTDLLIDLLVAPVTFKFTTLPDLRVHGGFNLAYTSIRDHLIDELHRCIHIGDRITMVGHSLGGALATLAMIDCLDEFPESNISGYTIGSPRVLTNKSVKTVNGLFDYLSRATNPKDPIVRVPFKVMGYEHIGDVYNLEPSTPLSGPFKYHLIDAYIDMFRKSVE